MEAALKKYSISISFLIFTLVAASGCRANSTPEIPSATSPGILPNASGEGVPTPSATEAFPEPTLTLVEGVFRMMSPAFGLGDDIPVRYSCHGEDISPPLQWTSVPGGSQSFALIMDDPDAVPVAGFVWDHWLMFNIPAEAQSLPEGILGDGELPDGSRHGMNSFRRLGYGGPCPPAGQSHQYVFTLYALDTTLALKAGVTKDQLLAAMESHILSEAITSGVYTSP